MNESDLSESSRGYVFRVFFFLFITAACVKVDPEFPTRESFEHPLVYSTFRICSVQLRAPMISTNWDLNFTGSSRGVR